MVGVARARVGAAVTVHPLTKNRRLLQSVVTGMSWRNLLRTNIRALTRVVLRVGLRGWTRWLQRASVGAALHILPKQCLSFS